MEVELALSSQLLNNRLIFNGSFGYRDNTVNNNTFIGDFDLEYLLNKSGTIRLKAYNHYNDRNYYIKSALTTQGVGIMLRHDFNRWGDLFRKNPKTTVKPKIYNPILFHGTQYYPTIQFLQKALYPKKKFLRPTSKQEKQIITRHTLSATWHSTHH